MCTQKMVEEILTKFTFYYEIQLKINKKYNE